MTTGIEASFLSGGRSKGQTIFFAQPDCFSREYNTLISVLL